MENVTIHQEHKSLKSANAAIAMGYADGAFTPAHPAWIVEEEGRFLVVTDTINYLNCVIRYDADNQSYFWESSNYVIGREGFEDVCKARADILHFRQCMDRWLGNPITYIAGCY